MITSDQILRERAALVQKMRALFAEAEKRGDKALSAEDQAKWDRMDTEVAELEKRAGILRKQEALDDSLEGTEDPQVDADVSGEPDSRQQQQTKYEQEFRAYVRTGRAGPIMVAERDQRDQRALQVDADTLGGYLAPEAYRAELIKAVDNLVFMRRLAEVIPVADATSLGAPALDNDPADPTWTSELGTGAEDSTMSFGKRELAPQPCAQRLKVSRTLLRKSVIPAESLVRDRMAYKFGVIEENAFLNGSGANQPLGVFTASAHGISTSRDVSTGNTTTEVKGDGLYEAKFTLKGQYWGRAAWIFNRAVLKQIAKLKDGEGRYLWQPSIAAGHPDTLLQLPVYMSEYAPSTMTTGLYVGIVGDFKNYWIADSMRFAIQALYELYAATNQVGFIGRIEVDGMPVLEEAFARVKLA